MVKNVFQKEFDAELKIYSTFRPEAYCEAYGSISADEIVLALSLLSPGQLGATTIYASTDFDPKATSPTAEDLLAVCIDGLDSVLRTLFNREKPDEIEKLAGESLSATENIPFDWTSIEVQRRKVFIKLDKANLSIERLTEDWLKKNDPLLKQEEELEAEKSSEVIITHKIPTNNTH
jgi:hypothetical protein